MIDSTNNCLEFGASVTFIIMYGLKLIDPDYKISGRERYKEISRVQWPPRDFIVSVSSPLVTFKK